ncbi:MAG: tetratricopeptide repeat protein [Phycisphaerae bacterium]
MTKKNITARRWWQETWWHVTAILLIAGVTITAYCNSFMGREGLRDAPPFVLDDPDQIENNIKIRDDLAFNPWKVMTEGGALCRPVAYLTLSLNYAFSRWWDQGDTRDRSGQMYPTPDAHMHAPGLHEWSYHVFNLAVHVLAALTLYGIVRRTLQSPRLRDRFGLHAPLLALIVTLIWAVHPMHTSAVTYIIQREESLMGLMYFLTIYCAIRIGDSRAKLYWVCAALLAGIVGMGTKQIMVTAPIMLLAYDWVFMERSDPIRRRLPWYILAACVMAGMTTLKPVVFGALGIEPRVFRDVVYFGLASLPMLVLLFDLLYCRFDSAAVPASNGAIRQLQPPNAPAEARWRLVLYMAVLATYWMLAVSINATPMNDTAGFAMQNLTKWEYARTEFGVITKYLRLFFAPYPLCLDYALPVANVYGDLPSWLGGGDVPSWTGLHIGPDSVFYWPLKLVFGQVFIYAVLILALVGLTFYALWRWPTAGFLGLWYFGILAPSSSIMPIRDKIFEFRVYLSNAALISLIVVGGYRLVSLAHQKIARTRPRNARIYELLLSIAPWVMTGAAIGGGLIFTLWQIRGDVSDSPWKALLLVAALGLVVALLPVLWFLTSDEEDSAGSTDNRMFAWIAAGGEVVLLLAAMTLLRNHDYRSAEAIWRQTLSLVPNNARVHSNLGVILIQSNKLEEGLFNLREAVRCDDKFLDAIYNLGVMEGKFAQQDQQAGKRDEAAQHMKNSFERYRRCLEVDPNYLNARYNLGVALQDVGKLDDAEQEYLYIIKVEPAHIPSYCNLGVIYGIRGQADKNREKYWLDKAFAMFRKALDLDNRNYQAHDNIARCYMSMGRFEDALASFMYETEICPRDPELFKKIREGVLNCLTALKRQEDIPRYEQILQKRLVTPRPFPLSPMGLFFVPMFLAILLGLAAWLCVKIIRLPMLNDES